MSPIAAQVSWDRGRRAERSPVCVSQAKGGQQVKKGYVGIHSSGFNDFLLKPELSQVVFDSRLAAKLRQLAFGMQHGFA